MNSEVSGKQHSCGSQSNSAREGDEHGRICVQDSAGSIPGQMRKQQEHRTDRSASLQPCLVTSLSVVSLSFRFLAQ